jgi:hypothetical protein
MEQKFEKKEYKNGNRKNKVESKKINVVSKQIRTRVRTSCYYSPNKIIIARTTYYYYSENKFTSHLEQ